MRYGSVCSGIEAATVAWHPLGWEPTFFAEIEKFPSAVLAHRYPGVPNWGDITKFKEWPDAAIDVLVGGTPCQSFSVAGLRQGLADPRGNLCLTFLAIADRYRPQWLLWENVPGVLSSDGGRDFGAFLGGLGQLGYGWSYRVLDAQYVRVDGFERAVPQRRRRVFVVGYLGDYRRAAAVLFERESLSGHPAPRRQAGQGTAVPGAPCFRAGGNDTGGNRPYGTDVDTCDSLIAFDGQNIGCDNQVSASLDSGGAHTNRGMHVAHPLRADGFDASEDGTGRGTPLVPIAFYLRGPRAISQDARVSCNRADAARYRHGPRRRPRHNMPPAGQVAVAFKTGRESMVASTDLCQARLAPMRGRRTSPACKDRARCAETPKADSSPRSTRSWQ